MSLAEHRLCVFITDVPSPPSRFCSTIISDSFVVLLFPFHPFILGRGWVGTQTVDVSPLRRTIVSHYGCFWGSGKDDEGVWEDSIDGWIALSLYYLALPAPYHVASHHHDILMHIRCLVLLFIGTRNSLSYSVACVPL